MTLKHVARGGLKLAKILFPLCALIISPNTHRLISCVLHRVHARCYQPCTLLLHARLATPWDHAHWSVHLPCAFTLSTHVSTCSSFANFACPVCSPARNIIKSHLTCCSISKLRPKTFLNQTKLRNYEILDFHLNGARNTQIYINMLCMPRITSDSH